MNEGTKSKTPAEHWRERPGAMEDERVGSLSAKIADEEARALKESEQRVTKMTLEIEEILLKHEATWLEWNTVVSTFNARNAQVIPKLTLKFIKDLYDRP